MSDVIQLLPDSVANQIAAGEVIQRPASVVKELVENAVDAGATDIQLLVTDAGRTSIQVVDNGKGMSDTDARLAFERHATSKIRKADDLFTLQTMGFRGEALPSIAAVAQVELKTRAEGEDVGTHLSIAASRFGGQEPCACPRGSNFTVSNLFYNVPARRKFLKSNSTELSNIMSAFERIVLVNPGISFSLHSNGSEMVSLKRGSLRQRITDVFGKRLNQDLLPLNVETTMCHIYGFVGKPESAKKKGAKQFFFANGRYMKHPYFHKAVANAMERLVPVGEQVPYFIYFELPPEDIDVNIHPTKTEIKFENEQPIWQILAAAVKDAVGLYNEIPAIDFDTEGRPDIPAFSPGAGAAWREPSVDFNPRYNPFNESGGHDGAPEDWQELFASVAKKREAATEPLFEQCEEAADGGRESQGLFQYKGRYIMAAVKSGLMIIDQNRAHTRVLYDGYVAQMERSRVGSQKLLFPEVVQFTPGDDAVMGDIAADAARLGFETTPLGGGSYSISAVPSTAETLSPELLLRDMVDAAREKGAGVMEHANHRMALTLARRAAIPSGRVMGAEAMEDLFNSLFACQNPNYTPDGKAVLHILPQQDIESMLG